MIYFRKDIENKIITDNYLDYIPPFIKVKIGDTFLNATVLAQTDPLLITNEATLSKYTSFSITLPTEISYGEYEMKLYDQWDLLLKRELIEVKKTTTNRVVSYQNKKQIKQYQK